MRINDTEQETTDFDWFAADEQGFVAHFASAGFKRLPATVSSSAEDLKMITDYFVNRAPIVSGYRVNPDVGLDRRDWKGAEAEARYLRSFVEMATRGLYSYDIETYVNPKTAYFCVTIPTRPLSLKDLPHDVCVIVRRTVLRGVSLTSVPRIEYSATLEY